MARIGYFCPALGGDFHPTRTTIKEENFKINASGGYNRLYAHFLQCKHNPIIDPTKEYYAISLSKDLTSISAQTQWVGWADDDHTLELRRLAPIVPESYVKLCRQVYEKPMVINSKEDVDVFVIFGGHAIIRTDICEKYLPLFCKDFVSPTREY